MFSISKLQNGQDVSEISFQILWAVMAEVTYGVSHMTYLTWGFYFWYSISYIQLKWDQSYWRAGFFFNNRATFWRETTGSCSVVITYSMLVKLAIGHLPYWKLEDRLTRCQELIIKQYTLETTTVGKTETMVSKTLTMAKIRETVSLSANRSWDKYLERSVYTQESCN